MAGSVLYSMSLFSWRLCYLSAWFYFSREDFDRLSRIYIYVYITVTECDIVSRGICNIQFVGIFPCALLRGYIDACVPFILPHSLRRSTVWMDSSRK